MNPPAGRQIIDQHRLNEQVGQPEEGRGPARNTHGSRASGALMSAMVARSCRTLHAGRRNGGGRADGCDSPPRQSWPARGAARDVESRAALSAQRAVAVVSGSSAPEQVEPLVWLQLLVAASITIGTRPARTSKTTHPAPVPFARVQVASL
jgi:hypothetical protein